MKIYMKLLIAALATATTIAFVYGQNTDQKTFEINAELEVQEIENDIYLVTHRFPWAGNSLLVRITPGDFILVDTPWDSSGTEALLKWFWDKYDAVNLTAINTHFHRDNLGGNGYLLSRNVPVYSTDLTVELLEEKREELKGRTLRYLNTPEYKKYYEAYAHAELKAADHVFKSSEGLILHFGDRLIELFYPGPGHTEDNIVVYFPEKKLLFAGCLIKSADTDRIGIQSDANFDEWPDSAKRLLDKYKECRIVVPGHGKWGDLDIIRHTIELLGQT
jgi:glyoxylase-like metal-dependent hydrolase (beta-lactamase superfamily II)